MAAVIAAFVNERESDTKIPKKKIPAELLGAFDRLVKGIRPFVWQMLKRGFDARTLHLRPVVAIYAWAYGKPWEQVRVLAEMEDGDLVMLILRTADNLRHIRGLRKAFPQAAQAAHEAIELILREPVVYNL
jgi:superfamily II RNA helicase